MSGIEMTEAALAELADVYKEYDQKCKDARKEAYTKMGVITKRTGIQAIAISLGIFGTDFDGDGYVHLANGLIGSGIVTARGVHRGGYFSHEHSAIVAGVKFIQLETKEEAGNE